MRLRTIGQNLSHGLLQRFGLHLSRSSTATLVMVNPSVRWSQQVGYKRKPENPQKQFKTCAKKEHKKVLGHSTLTFPRLPNLPLPSLLLPILLLHLSLFCTS
jgi:hypothetical protein